jgi:hypothetical protein
LNSEQKNHLKATLITSPEGRLLTIGYIKYLRFLQFF